MSHHQVVIEWRIFSCFKQHRTLVPFTKQGPPGVWIPLPGPATCHVCRRESSEFRAPRRGEFPCIHCEQPRSEHPAGWCMFAPTQFTEGSLESLRIAPRQYPISSSKDGDLYVVRYPNLVV